MSKRRRNPGPPHPRGRTHLIAAGALTLALGSIVLQRAPSVADDLNAADDSNAAEDSNSVAPSGASRLVRDPLDGAHEPSTFEARGLSGSIELSQRAVPTGRPARVFAEVNLEASANRMGEPAPIALSLVLDTSGSMRGDKIQQAREAVREVVAQLGSADLFSLVTYNAGARVRIPLTPARELLPNLDSVLRGVVAGGGTRIPPALSLAAASLEASPEGYVRRVVLVSDGQDNSPRSPSEIQASLQRFAAHGSTFSAMGLGTDYNEDFLTNVADAGAGNYAFVESAEGIRPFMNRELESVRSTMFDQIVAELTLPPGWEFGRGYGVAPSTRGDRLSIPVGQLSAGEHRKVVVELHGPAGVTGTEQVVEGRLRYRSVEDLARHTLAAADMHLRTVSSEREAIAQRVRGVYTRTHAVAIDEAQRDSIEAWRQGDVSRAVALTQGNYARLQGLRSSAPASLLNELEQRQAAFDADLANFRNHTAHSSEGRAWGLNSNSMRRGRSL